MNGDTSMNHHEPSLPQTAQTLSVKTSQTLIKEHSTQIRSYQSEYIRDHDGAFLLDQDQQPITVDRILATKPLRHELSTRPGPGNRKLTYMSGDCVTRSLNAIFGFDGWSLEVKNTNREECIKDEKGRYHAAYTATVRILHNRSGVFKEDCGAGDAIDRSLGTAIANALKASVTDAMKRASRHFGDKLGNSLYQGDFSANKAPNDLKQALRVLNEEKSKRMNLSKSTSIKFLPPSNENSLKSLPPSDSCNSVQKPSQLSVAKEMNNNALLAAKTTPDPRNIGNAINKQVSSTKHSTLQSDNTNNKNWDEGSVVDPFVQSSCANAANQSAAVARNCDSQMVSMNPVSVSAQFQGQNTGANYVTDSNYMNRSNAKVVMQSDAPLVPGSTSSNMQTMGPNKIRNNSSNNSIHNESASIPPPPTSQQKLQSMGISRFNVRNKDTHVSDVPVLADITNLGFDYDLERPSTSHGKRYSLGSDVNASVKRARNPYTN